MAPAKLMFARKIHLVFNRLRPTEKKMDEKKKKKKKKKKIVNTTTPAKKYISRIINLEKQHGKKIKELSKCI